MGKYRFKTKEEIKEEDYWDNDNNCPYGWCDTGRMNHFMGKPVNDEHIDIIESRMRTHESFQIGAWYFHSWNFILDEPALPIEEIMKQIETNNQNSLTTKKKTKMKKAAVKTRNTEKFVFMDKTVQILDIGFETSKNIVLYGPGE